MIDKAAGGSSERVAAIVRALTYFWSVHHLSGSMTWSMPIRHSSSCILTDMPPIIFAIRHCFSLMVADPIVSIGLDTINVVSRIMGEIPCS